MENLKAFWGKLVAKATENKEVIIRGATSFGGAVLGVVIASLVIQAKEDQLLEEILMEVHDEEAED